VFTIHLPPLRERGDDLETLVQFYMRRLNRELQRNIQEVSLSAMNRLRSYAWPGNIRELQSVLKRSVLQTSGSILLEEFLSRQSAGNQHTYPLAQDSQVRPERSTSSDNEGHIDQNERAS
jgi:two-component system nitrogen regulation response regulator GlnG